jgi:hypothetical protein
MPTFLTRLRNTAIAGFFFLLPIVVIFVLITKAWNALTSVGTKMAGIFGVSSLVGFKGAHIFTGIALLAVCFFCGMLVRISFIAGLHGVVERWMSRYVPGYDTYKGIAEEKLQNKVPVLPYGAALIRHGEFWLPSYVIESDLNGNYVLFLPDIPETGKGHVLVATKSDVTLMESLTANQLDACLKRMGQGLLDESGLAHGRSSLFMNGKVPT